MLPRRAPFKWLLTRDFISPTIGPATVGTGATSLFCSGLITAGILAGLSFFTFQRLTDHIPPVVATSVPLSEEIEEIIEPEATAQPVSLAQSLPTPTLPPPPPPEQAPPPSLPESSLSAAVLSSQAEDAISLIEEFEKSEEERLAAIENEEKRLEEERKKERARLAEQKAKEAAEYAQRQKELAAERAERQREQAIENAKRQKELAAQKAQRDKELAAERQAQAQARAQQAQARAAEAARQAQREKEARVAREQAALSKKVASTPVIQRRPKPSYPRSAKKAGQEGTTQITATITTKGRISSPRISKSSGFPALDAAALSAVKKWRFTPAKNALGNAIPYQVSMPVSFRLN